MKQIDNLSDAALQSTQVVLDDGSIVQFVLAYQAATQRWAVDVTYGAFVLRGVNICAGLNILDAWDRVLPFGLAVVPVDGVDPVYYQDFVGLGDAPPRVTMYVLSKAEAAQVRAGTFGT